MLSTENLSVQLYTVREALSDDVDATLARLAAAGYQLVEPFAFTKFFDGLKSGLAAHGLSAPTTHASLVDADDVDDTLAAAKELGIQTVIDPHTDPKRWSSAEEVAKIAASLNAAAEKAAAHGLSVGYHNHAFELENSIDGRHALEVFADHLDPAVRLEVDTYWAYAGGADVPALLGRLGERVLAIHIKDGDGTKDVKNQTAVGSGSLPVWDYIDAVPNLGYGVVELDDSATDRFVAVEESFSYLSKGRNA
ncbi:sugar phosphate isomerase/epimerase [Friedmanniella endophytica]|jgi:sugar phosphate isomerase/epimerase|uniref:Sugar phosphate isomerase/epimerase n=1 Tax=Microlunatus kandeliicorticis TaxID=1759536 RepID=A0A7W3IQQ1_9ACTN|nr:sugar phosphate isomerase/epimerase [Microlunatus kandeliicorticis]MBA8793492.1 sugar phosphate isomerase/epimerase [Microlunatus kandeliicorticis]